jgi:primosomal protein N'
MLDPAADLGRRAWVACERCDDGAACASCAASASCEQHWRYLLEAARRHLFLQCPACHHRWWHDSGFGVDDRGSTLTDLPEFPAPRRAG